MSYNFQKFDTRASEILEHLKKEYSSIRTGQATPALLDGVNVESYGSKQPISHVASVSIEDPKTLKISPWDTSNIPAIESAISAANLGVSLSVDNTGIRVIFPDLTEESRKNFVKILKDHLEKARISIKQEREKIWNDISEKEKSGELTEDDKFRLKDELQKKVDAANEALEKVADEKTKQVMQI